MIRINHKNILLKTVFALKYSQQKNTKKNVENREKTLKKSDRTAQKS